MIRNLFLMTAAVAAATPAPAPAAAATGIAHLGVPSRSLDDSGGGR